MNSNLFELTVCVNNRPIREYGHQGLLFVEGRKNQPYTLKFRNNYAQRVLAVVSVDGLSVVDGEPADNDSRGYVVPALSQIEITGWRSSLDKTNEFVFDTKARANSTQHKGEDTNCGVIAVKVFSEKLKLNDIQKTLLLITNEFEQHWPPCHHHHHHHYPYPYPYHYPAPPVTSPFDPFTTWCGITNEGAVRCSTAANDPDYSGCTKANNMSPPDDGPVNLSSNALAQETPDFNLGTGWGKEKSDTVTETAFDRGVELACFSIYYSDAGGLKAAGIKVDKKPEVSKPVLPRGFGGFCRPPKVCS